MSPKSKHYQEARSNLECNVLTTLRFITKKPRVEVGEGWRKGKEGERQRVDEKDIQ